ncbi:hypothetical protein [[Eubacterium] cellulosolvens]
MPSRIIIEKQGESFNIILTKQAHERVMPAESWEEVIEILRKESPPSIKN